MEPALSVIITCYNQNKFIEQTIESVLAQTKAAIISEIIVIDDGSTDNSAKIIFKKMKESALLRYFYQENKGVSSARNKGIELARGNLIAFLDGDDIWTPSKLEKQVKCFENNLMVGLTYCDFYEVDATDITKKKRIRPKRYTPSDLCTLDTFFVKDGPIMPSSVIIRKDVLDNIGWFDSTFLMGEEADLWLRIAAKYHFDHIREPLLLKRVVFSSLGSNTELNNYYYDVTTKKISLEYPHLLPLIGKRNARRKTKLALYYEKIGEKHRARYLYKEAIKLDFTFWKPYFYLFFSFFPLKFKNYMIHYLKILKHGF